MCLVVFLCLLLCYVVCLCVFNLLLGGGGYLRVVVFVCCVCFGCVRVVLNVLSCSMLTFCLYDVVLLCVLVCVLFVVVICVVSVGFFLFVVLVLLFFVVFVFCVCFC